MVCWVSHFFLCGNVHRLATVRGQNPPSLEQGWWANPLCSAVFWLNQPTPVPRLRSGRCGLVLLEREQSAIPPRFPDEEAGLGNNLFLVWGDAPTGWTTVRWPTPPALEQGWWANSVRSGGLGLRKRAPALNPWARLSVDYFVPASTSADPGTLLFGAWL